MPGKPRTIDEYLKPLSKENRAALERLRKAIQAAAPEAEECISYDIPGFRWNGKLLASFGGWAKHCAFYPGSTPVEVHKDQLKNYETTKGTIRFHPDSPLPASLVRSLVNTQIAKLSRRSSLRIKR